MKRTNVMRKLFAICQFSCAKYQSRCPWEKRCGKCKQDTLWANCFLRAQKKPVPFYMCSLILQFDSKLSSACSRELVHLNKVLSNRAIIILSVQLLHFYAALPIQVISARLYPCSLVQGNGKSLQTWGFLYLKQCFSIDSIF